MKITCIICFLMIFCISAAYGKEEESPETPPAVGNFILPGSQQPGPLIGFGENILNQNQTQLTLAASDAGGIDNETINIGPSLLYGLRDNFSIFFNLPITVSAKNNQNRSAGFRDASLQLEYAFYANSTYNYTDLATLVTNTTIPTGSSSKDPATGFGSPSYFLGATFNRTYINWILFTAYGAVLTTSNAGTQFGNQFLYQAGVGRNLFDIDSSWIFAWIVEADGQYSQQNKINGVIDSDSGGNIVYVTPSLSVSSKKLIFQLGAGLPITQHLFGNQERNNYLLALNLSWIL